MHRPIVWESCALLLENFFVIVINHIGGPLSDALLDREKQKRSSDKKHTVNNFNIQWKLCSAKQDLHNMSVQLWTSCNSEVLCINANSMIMEHMIFKCN